MSSGWRDRVLALDPCHDAREWIAALPAETTYAEAWALCPRGDWSMWLLARCEPVRSSASWSDARRPLVAAGVECARLALPAYEARYPGDDRVRRCLDTTAAWARGEATREEVLEARRDADYAAADYAVAVADAAADATGERARVLSECAGIVRGHFPLPPELA